MRFPTSLSALALITLAFGQANAVCKWDSCCYTSHDGPGACPPQQWHFTLVEAYCEVSICPVGCVNLKDGSACSCCDIATGSCTSC